jgi:hypothetical protein
MSDEHKNYILVQGASGSELSFTYNAENITVVQLLYQLDEAKKKKDVNVFEELVTISEAVFLQDKFNQLPLEDRLRLKDLVEDQAELKDQFYEFKNEVLYEHFPGIESEFEEYRSLFENARNEIYESKQLVENNKLSRRAEAKLIKSKAREERKTIRLEERLRKKQAKEINRKSSNLRKNTILVGRFIIPGALSYISLLELNNDFDWFMSGYNEVIAGSLIGLVGGAAWNLLITNEIK